MKRVILYISVISLLNCIACSEQDAYQKPDDRYSNKILIDASHDGGVWWYPQAGSYFPGQHHQGKALADLLRSYGFVVDELPSYTLITDSILNGYDKVVRVGFFGNYQTTELQAYDHLLSRRASLLLVSEFEQPAQIDQLAERLGIKFRGAYFGNVDTYALHTITQNATSFYFNAGAIVTNSATNPNIVPLGWLSGNLTQPVLGVLKGYPSKVLFLGEVNGLQTIPQPLTNNIIQWLFL